MKSHSKIIMGTLVAVLVIAAPFAAQARHGGYGYGPGPDGPGGWHQAIPQEQRDAVYGMMREHRAKVQPLRDELWTKRTMLDALSGNPNADVKEIKSLVEEVGALRGKLRAEHDAFSARVKKDTGIDVPGSWCGKYGDGYGRHRGYGGHGGYGGHAGYGRHHGGRW